MPDKTEQDGVIDRRAFLGISVTAALGLCIPAVNAQLAPASTLAEAGISLHIAGDASTGYAVILRFKGSPVTSKQSGELSGVFENGERSLRDRVDGWKATRWSGNESRISLQGDAYLEKTNATVHIVVTYEVLSRNIVRKQISLHQSDMFMLYCQLSNQIDAAETPAKFWSFDQADCSGGPLREYFPSAGFRTKAGITIGLLSDAGFRNGWSRMYRRDGKPIKPAPAAVPDPNLYVVASHAERELGHSYIRQTFGEELVVESGPTSRVALPDFEGWRRIGTPMLKGSADSLEVIAGNADDAIVVPFAATAGMIYSVAFEYRCSSDLSIAIWDIDKDNKQVQDFNQFNDRAPASPERWTTFDSTVFVSDIQGSTAALVFSLPQAQPTSKQKLNLRNLKLAAVPAVLRPYHRLEMDEPIERTSFVFVNETVPDTRRGYRLASELHLADALKFRGGETEKVLYADLMMLCWNAGTETFRPMLAPSIYYSAAGEMYLRDSFFALNGTHNKTLNEQVCNLWAENQGQDGAINTLVEPEMTNLERKSNDSTPLWLMWVLLNQRRFGIAPPMDKVIKAARYCLNTYDPKGDGACVAQFVMGQLDIVAYPQGTSVICQNQGLLAVTLHVIRELNIPGISNTITEGHISQAEELYRSYYDPVRKFMLPARDIKDAIGFAELFPEYLSLWLFNRKILTDDMVLNHLGQMPVMLPRADCPYPELGGTVRPVFIGLTDHPGKWLFFTETWHPMASDSYAASYADKQMDGVYYNGGSWMRIEVCAYVVGKMHGWKIAEKAIRNRLWAEINIDPDFPTSQEYLATDPKHPFFGSHRVFAWNSAVLQALELAGLRTPDMDPDYTGSQLPSEAPRS